MTAAAEASSIPETIFGVFCSPQVWLLGSIRSGENPTWKSAPARRPDPASRIGTNTSSVVPGYVVDSSTTVAPARTCGASSRAASSM